MLYVSGGADDQAFFARIARRWETVKLLVARSGRAGLQAVMERRLALVVVDARLPDLDATQLVGALRRRAVSPEAPIVVLADDPAPRDEARFIWAGASAFLTKPLDVAQIDDTVRRLLEVAPLR